MEEQQDATPQKRNVAVKISIKELQSGEYVKEQGMTPNFVTTKKGKVSRVNLMGVVVSKEEGVGFDTISIDDSTSTISLRSFEDREILKKPNIGGIVLVIGKIREYGGEKYILPEIVKPMENNRWAILRKKELGTETEAPEATEESFSKEEKAVEEDIDEEKEDTSKAQSSKAASAKAEPLETPSSYEAVLKLIKELDKGQGVSYEDVTSESKDNDCEQIIKALLEEGEIFEVRPGILKVL